MAAFFRMLSGDRHVAFCPMNFVADTYIGCPHSCWYFYAPASTCRGRFEESSTRFRKFRRRIKSENDFGKIENAITQGQVKGTCERGQEQFIAEAIRHRHPLRVGSLSDPFGLPLEKEYGDTRRVLEILVSHDYPFVVCTKSPFVATPTYVNLLKSADGKAAAQISLMSLDDDLLKHLESRPGAATPSAKSRLEALRRLSNEGVFTTCRIQPMIPQVTEYGMEDLINAVVEAGVDHIIVEFLWLPLVHAKDMGSKLKMALDEYCRAGGIVGDDLRRHGNDLNAFYRSYEDSERAYGRVFYSKRQMARLMPVFADMIAEANREHNAKVTFGSGNEEISFLNSTENCCGVDRLPAFSGYPKCIAQTALRSARIKGRVSLDQVRQHYNPYAEKFTELWNKRNRKGYFFEDRVFKLRGVESDHEVEYAYDDAAIPS